MRTAFAPDHLKEGEFCGYATIFGARDEANDVVAPGAFRRSLRAKSPAQVKLLYQHRTNDPIGVWRTIMEDARGLFVRGALVMTVPRARDVWELMRAGAVDGLSIGFRAVRGRKDERTGARLLLDLDLFEISIVTFPMLPQARVNAVKARCRPPGHI